MYMMERMAQRLPDGKKRRCEQQRIYTLAGYVQHDMEIVRNLSATLGVRYTKHGTFGNNFTPKVALM